MDMIQITFQDFSRFLLIFIRVGVILFLLPFFNSRVIPILVKVGLTFLISLTLWPVVQNQIVEFPATVTGIVQLVISELIVGMTLGFIAQMFFEGIRLMGEIVGFQTGFYITNIIDPQNGVQVSILSNVAYLMAVVLFLLLNGHHVLLTALRESFEIIHVGELNLNRKILQEIVMHAGDIFVVGIKIGAPAIAVLLFAQIIFGLITKLIPQMNIMIVAFPLQISIGLFFFGISLRAMLFLMERYLGNLDRLLIHTMQWMKV